MRNGSKRAVRSADSENCIACPTGAKLLRRGQDQAARRNPRGRYRSVSARNVCQQNQQEHRVYGAVKSLHILYYDPNRTSKSPESAWLRAEPISMSQQASNWRAIH